MADRVLTGGELPDSFSYSITSNCGLVEFNDEESALLATRDICEGEVYTIAPEEDSEYEEWVLDTATGDLVVKSA